MDENFACKEVVRALHLDVIDLDAAAAYWANQGNGVGIDLWCLIWQELHRAIRFVGSLFSGL